MVNGSRFGSIAYPGISCAPGYEEHWFLAERANGDLVVAKGHIEQIPKVMSTGIGNPILSTTLVYRPSEFVRSVLPAVHYSATVVALLANALITFLQIRSDLE